MSSSSQPAVTPLDLSEAGLTEKKKSFSSKLSGSFKKLVTPRSTGSNADTPGSTKSVSSTGATTFKSNLARDPSLPKPPPAAEVKAAVVEEATDAKAATEAKATAAIKSLEDKLTAVVADTSAPIVKAAAKAAPSSEAKGKSTWMPLLAVAVAVVAAAAGVAATQGGKKKEAPKPAAPAKRGFGFGK